MAEVSGMYDSRFEPVRDALAEQLESGNELGASIVVDVDGDTVVDIWGGWRDADQAVDRAAQRFGAGVVRPAALVPRDGDDPVRPSLRPPRPPAG